MSVPRPLLALLLLAGAGPAGAANFRLSEAQPWSDVYVSAAPDPLVTPDGRWIFYRQDAEVDEAVELWRVPAVGGTPERISGLLPSGSNVFGVELTPDGSRVVFHSPQDDVDVHELFSAPVGAAPGSYVKINAPLPAGFRVHFDSDYSPDSQRVLYASVASDVPATDAERLWVAEVDGGAQTPIVTLPLDRRIRDIAAAPDFTRAFYIADSLVAGRDELWSVPTAGGTPVKLNGALAAGGDVQQFQVSPDGASVLYLADQQVDERPELFVVPAGGGVATKLSGALPAGHGVAGAAFSPDGGRVIYIEQDLVTGELVELWSVAPSGGARAGLFGAMVTGGQPVFLAFDSAHVVFVADKQVDEVFELYSTPIGGGTIVKLNPPLPTGGDVVTSPPAGPRITPDGARVVYAADQGANGIDNVYVVPIGGGASVAVGGATTFGSSTVRSIALSDDGTRVARVRAYRLLPGQPIFVHLSVAELDGGSWRQVDSCPETGEVADPVRFSPSDAKTVFYLADQQVDGRWDLYAGDICLLCDGFEVGSTARWSATVP